MVDVRLERVTEGKGEVGIRVAAHAEGHEWVEMPEERLNVGQSAILDAHEIHDARFLEDCQYMAITVPQCEDWPA